MLTRRAFQTVLGRLCWLAFMLALLPSAKPAIGEGQAPETAYVTYMPLVLSHGSLYGRVTHNGAPVANVLLVLYVYNGSSWSVQTSTLTGPGGDYQFVDQPSLPLGYRYMVEYTNSSDSSRLGYWDTQQITTYLAGTVVQMGDFDVANVQLVDPGHGAAISLPYTFKWVKRSATPTDFYRVGIFDISDFDPYVTTGTVGWVSELQTPSSLPPGFITGVTYYWWVEILGGGARGASYWANALCFSNCPAISTADAGAGSRPTALVRAEVERDGPLGPGWESAVAPENN
jgi:hypothetical protein